MSNFTESDNLISLDFQNYRELIGGGGDDSCYSFFRECGDFSLCINIGERGYILA